MNIKDRFLALTGIDPEHLVYRMLPHFLMEVAGKYFRLEVEGLENIPRRGPALICPNHSGFSGLDAFLLGHEVFKNTARVPRILTHHLWFLSPLTAIPAEKVGFIEASMSNGLAQLKKNNLVILFPEGEQGNFKPSSDAYQLQEFKRGFVRMALLRQCPIVPTLVIGAEESHINLAQIKLAPPLSRFFGDLVLPVPLNVVPLPSKWKFKFLPPIQLPYQPAAVDDRDLVDELATEIQDQMQMVLNEEIAKRSSAFFD